MCLLNVAVVRLMLNLERGRVMAVKVWSLFIIAIVSSYYSNLVTFQTIVILCNLATKATSYPQLCNSPPRG